MLTLAHVQSFVAVIEQGGFHGAARHLNISQPTVTKHVKALEADLACSLVVRAHGVAGLTKQGRQFLPFARMLLRTAARARAALDDKGIVIAASSNIGVYLLQPLVKAFTEAAVLPGPIDIRIGSNIDTVEWLANYEVDIALMEWWDDRPGFEACVWRNEPLVVIVSPDHPWAGLSSIGKQELLQEPLIGGEPGTGTGRLLTDKLGLGQQSFKPGLQLGSTEAVKRAVRAGLGVSLTMASVVQDEIAAGLLHALEIRDAPLAKALYAIRPADLPPAGAVHQFEEFLLRANA